MAPGRRAHLRRGQALRRRTESLAQAGELETKALARRAQAEGKLPAAQVQARQTRVLAREELNNEIAAAHQQLQERQAPSPPGGRCRGQRGQSTSRASCSNMRRAGRTGTAGRAGPRLRRTGPGGGPASQELSDAAQSTPRPSTARQEADHLDQLATKQRRTPLQLIGLRSLIRTGPPFSDSCHTLPCRAMRLPVGSGGGIGYDAIPQQLTSPPHRDPAQLPDRGRGRTEWIISVCLPARLEYSIVALACLFSWRRAACHAAIWYSCVRPPRTCFRRIWYSARLISGGRQCACAGASWSSAR